jgi:hypothetical protein
MSLWCGRPVRTTIQFTHNGPLVILMMDPAAVTRYITDTFPGVAVVDAAGSSFFFHGPDRMMPFVTLVTNDDHDRASDLTRPGIFRLNIGVTKETYRSLFGARPTRAATAEGVVDTGHDFTALDQLMPHPVYAPQSWVCVLSPTADTFESVIRPLLAEAYGLAVRRAAKTSANAQPWIPAVSAGCTPVV